MKIFLPLFLLLHCSLSYSQNLAGVWEGFVMLSDARSERLNIRLELMQEGKDCYGLLYSRGYQKKIMFGCDYIVTGRITDNTLQLRWANVQRSVSMDKNDCSQMAAIVLKLKDSVSLEGIWQWILGESVPAECKKVSDSISVIAKDEFTLFRSSLLKSYEEQNVFLKVEERFAEIIHYSEIDTSDLVIELKSADSTAMDSIDIYLNGGELTTVNNLLLNPVRLRLKELPTGENNLIIVNKSESRYNATIRIILQYKGVTKELLASPSGSTNAVLYFKRN